MKGLTKAEEDVMKILWKIGEGGVNAILETIEGKKPAYNTISTIIRILEEKEFVGYTKKGRFHIYHPLVRKEDYSNQRINGLVEGFFQGSFESMVSFFIKKNDISLEDMEKALNELNKKK